MLKNIIIVALRNIRKDIGYSSINILGLTLGISSALMLVIYISDELSYDRYHEKADRIYRVSSTITETDDQFTWIVAQIPFGHQVREDYPEVETAVRIFNFGRNLFRFDDKEFYEENFYYADSSIFDLFSYRFVSGSAHSALTEPNTMVITRSAAYRYFGNSEPIGLSLVSGDRPFRVTAVIEDIPYNSHLRYDALISRSTLPEELGNWGNFGVFTYLLLPADIDIEEFSEKLNGMYEKYMAEIFERMGISIEYNLEPITRIHLYSTHAGEPEPTGSIAYVSIFGVVAIFLILIASMNYMNLATARSIRRAREVGLRKVVGSGRPGLIMQFLAESATLTIISLLLSLFVVALLLPEFNRLAGKNFEINIVWSLPVITSLIVIILVAGFIGGSYPAFFLSRFNPVKVLKGEISGGKSGNLLRKILVVIQFTVSVVMIICTMMVFRQINFLKNKDLGYKMDNIIAMQLDNQEMARNLPVFKESLLKSGYVESVTFTNAQMGEGSPKIIFRMETNEGMADRGVNFAIVDHDFIETMGIQMIKGRNFNRDMPTDTLLAVLVNETLAARMNWDDPIGKRVEVGEGEQLRAVVIGVIKDYNQTGVYNEVESLMMIYRYHSPFIYVRLGPDVQSGIRHIEGLWRELYPGQPFTYFFLADKFAEQFEGDEKRGFIFMLFTVLAILIASMGLFGLASYMVEQRTREIGIRKVFGAGEMSIVTLISRDFILLVSVSILLAFPVAWYFMKSWLENFAYHTGMSMAVFAGAAVIILVITLATVNIQAWKAAMTNPSDSLRVE
jgi:putative ABC transport system permease protein